VSLRTINDATAELEALADVVSGPVHAALAEELEQARSAASEVALRAHEGKLQQAGDLSDRMLDDQRELANEFTQLTSRATQAEDSARSLAEELARQRTTQRKLARQTDEIGRAIEQLRVIENDPIGWVDSTLYETYPLIRPDFSL
jgi:DNA repair exonuclease SbcCD ATPase subunit